MLGSFLDSLRSHFRLIQPAQTAHHVKEKIFMHGSMHTCSHVFRRIASVKPPLTPPYTGPHRVLQKLDDQRYIIDINGRPATISTSLLVPGYVSAEGLTAPPLETSERPCTVRFSTQDQADTESGLPSPGDQVNSRGGVAVAPASADLASTTAGSTVQLGANAQRPRSSRKQMLMPRELYEIGNL